MPSFEEALHALLSDRHHAAVARFAARALADPSDLPSRKNYAVALFEAGRLAEAASMFEKFIEDEGAGSLGCLPMLFSLGHCYLERGDPHRSLLATAEFLDRSNERHPFYWEGVHNAACAWQQLGAELEARRLFRNVAKQRRLEDLPRGQRRLPAGPWPRRKIIETCFRILGLDRKARPARRCAWPVD